MKKKKIILIISLLSAFIAVFSPLTDFSAEAYTSGIFNYGVLPDGSVNISGLTADGKLQTAITIPETIDGKPVSQITHLNNQYNRNLKHVSIPGSVKTIGSSAFYRCSALETVILNEGLETISNAAFEECVELQSISIPNGTTKIGTSAFNNCKKLSSVTIPDSVRYIGATVFSGTKLYEDWSTGGSDILYINNHCIKAKTNVSTGSSGSYDVAEGTLTIAEYAFKNCKILEEIYLPESLANNCSLGIFRLHQIKYHRHGLSCC